MPESSGARHTSPQVAAPLTWPRTVIVIPTLNEADNIRELISKVRTAAPEADIFIVDDQSSDGTVERARQLLTDRPGHIVHVRQGPRGLGRSYAEAFQIAVERGYEAVVQMDADLSHNPADIPRLVAALQEADLVIGSRYCRGGGIEGWAIHRVLLSRFANLYARAITGIGVLDLTAGYRAWRASALRQLRLETVASAGYSIQIELGVRAHCAGLRIVEVPIVFTDRQRGESKVTLSVLTESFIMPWRLRAYTRRMLKEAQWHRS